MIWRCPSSAALSHNPSWWCASFRHSFKSSYVITSVIAMFQRITQDEDMRLSFKCSVVSNCCWSSLDHGTFFNNIAFGVIWMCSFIYYLLLLYFSHCPLFIDSSFSHLSLPPSWSNYCLCFLFMVHCIAPMWFNFQGVLRRIDVISVKDFADSIDILLCLTIFLLESTLTFQRPCLFKSSLLKWN